MSKKTDTIKDMVFFAQQNPSALAELISSLVTDVVTTVKVNGATSITIPTGDSVTETYSAKALSQYGDEMSNSVTLSLEGEVTGVTISGDTVTVAKTATADSFTIKATCGSVVTTMVVALVTE